MVEFTSHEGACRALAAIEEDKALSETPCQPDNERDPVLTVTLDLEIPNDRVCMAELDLIEAHLAELIRELLCQPDEDRE
jgi:hypothetical protein